MMMKRLRVFAVLAGLAGVTACAMPPGAEPTLAGGAFTRVETAQAGTDASRSASTPVSRTVRDERGLASLQLVPFRIGVSTTTVERLARRSGCIPRTGAGLLVDEGPVEVYRLQCEDGSFFKARCELRQCTQMR